MGFPNPVNRSGFTPLSRGATRALIGHELFTLLYVDGNEVARCHSSRPSEYPVAGRKPMVDTPWSDHVMKSRRAWLGIGAEAIRGAFFDHELILSMGLGTCINMPVVYDGGTIGTMNLLAREGTYTEASVERLRPFAPLLIPAFLSARARKGLTR